MVGVSGWELIPWSTSDFDQRYEPDQILIIVSVYRVRRYEDTYAWTHQELEQEQHEVDVVSLLRQHLLLAASH